MRRPSGSHANSSAVTSSRMRRIERVGRSRSHTPITEYLKDDPCAVRGDGRRPDEMARPWRAKGLSDARRDIRDNQPVLMAVTQLTAVRKPRGTPDLSDSK